MSAPCPHCGGTKTDPVPSSRTFVYLWARHLGYEVRQCGRCRHLRWMDPEEFHKHVAQTASPPLKPSPSRDWPNLTSSRSDAAEAPRTYVGVATAVADLAALETSDPPVSLDAPVAGKSPVITPPRIESEPEPLTIAAAEPQPGVQPASSAPPRHGACPKCGSAQYRRSHRRLVEKLLLRGAMARCRECECRFSLPRSRRRIQAGER